MPIDPSIALSYRSPQFKSTDPMEEFSSGLKLKSLLMQQQAAEQAQADDQAQREAFRASGGDESAYLKALLQGGNVKAYNAAQKSIDDRKKAQADLLKTGADTDLAKARATGELSTVAAKAIALHRDALAGVDTPQAAAQWLQAGYSDPHAGPIMARLRPFDQAVQSIPTDPAAFQQWKQQQALGATKFIELNKPSTFTTSSGQVDTVWSRPGLGGAPTALQTTQKVMSPAEIAKNQIERDKLAEDRRHHGVTEDTQKAANEGMDWKQDVDGNWVGLPKKAPVGGQVTPTTTTAPGKRSMQADRALAIIADAESYIPKATGSYVGTAYDEAARAFGKSTEGAKYTAKLKATEGALMMAQPRMEGPQSDKDVMLYRQMAAQIGDPTVPRDTKIAALAAVKQLHQKYANNPQGNPTPSALSPEDTQARDWALKNPGDPRAKQIMQRLGG